MFEELNYDYQVALCAVIYHEEPATTTVGYGSPELYCHGFNFLINAARVQYPAESGF